MTRPQTELEKSLQRELSISRLLVVLECGGHFHNIALSALQLKMVSDAIALAVQPDPADPKGELVQLRLGASVIPADVFEGMQDYYTEEELKKMDETLEV